MPKRLREGSGSIQPRRHRVSTLDETVVIAALGGCVFPRHSSGIWTVKRSFRRRSGLQVLRREVRSRRDRGSFGRDAADHRGASAGEFTGDVAHLTGSPALVSAIAKGDCQVDQIESAGLRQSARSLDRLATSSCRRSSHGGSCCGSPETSPACGSSAPAIPATRSGSASFLPRTACHSHGSTSKVTGRSRACSTALPSASRRRQSSPGATGSYETRPLASCQTSLASVVRPIRRCTT